MTMLNPRGERQQMPTINTRIDTTLDVRIHGKLNQSRCDVFSDTPSGTIGQFLGVRGLNANYKLVDDGLYECFR